MEDLDGLFGQEQFVLFWLTARTVRITLNRLFYGFLQMHLCSQVQHFNVSMCLYPIAR